MEGSKEGNVLFNDALNTFYLRLYGVRHMVKDNSVKIKFCYSAINFVILFSLTRKQKSITACVNFLG